MKKKFLFLFLLLGIAVLTKGILSFVPEAHFSEDGPITVVEDENDGAWWQSVGPTPSSEK